MTVESGGERRVVLGVDGEVHAARAMCCRTGSTSTQVGQSRLTTATMPSGSAGRGGFEGSITSTPYWM